MIDKLELRGPSHATFSGPVQQIMREINYLGGTARVRRSRHYAGVADLRPIGIDALLHAYCRHGNHDHKLELLDTGKKSYSELVAQIESTFDIDTLRLPITRLDLCADVVGTPVAWFQPRVRIRYKRFANERGEVEYEQMGNRKIETLIVGKRPNVFRIYDKVAEYKVQFEKLRRKASLDSDSLNFQKEFGYQPDAIVTRIERQFGGGRVPNELATFGKLVNAPDYNPFAPLEIFHGSSATLPTVEECGGVSCWLCGMQLHNLANEWGMQQLRAWLNLHSQGNAARILQRYARFLPGTGETAITGEQLYHLYRASVLQQLAA